MRLDPLDFAFVFPAAVLFADKDTASGLIQRKRFRIRTEPVGSFYAMDPNDFTDEYMIFFINRIIQRAKVFRHEDTKARR
jgi:hypothetical protein